MAGAAAAMLRGVARQTSRIPSEFVKASVATLEREAKASLARDTGGNRRLSRAGNVELTIDVKVTEGGQTVHASVSAGTPQNQWSWLEDGTKPRRQGRGRHPGTSGKGTWTRAVSPVIPLLVDDVVKRWQKAVGG